MKNVLLLTALISSSLLANAASTIYQYPIINGVSADNLCDAGSTFKSIHAVKVCTKWVTTAATGESYQGNESVCVASTTKSLAISKSYESSTCLDSAPANESTIGNSCQNVSKAIKQYGKSVTVTVLQDQGEAGFVQVGEVSHIIPACK